MSDEIENMSTSEKLDRLRKLYNSQYRTALIQSELVNRLEYLIAPLTIQDLVELLQAGWELVPPEEPEYKSMESLAKQIDAAHKRTKLNEQKA